MKKAFFVSIIGVLAVGTSCTSTAYFRTSGYTDDLYGSPRGAAPAPTVERVYATATPQEYTVQQTYRQEQPASQAVSVNPDEYYPGMFEEALTGNTDNSSKAAPAKVQKSEKNQETNVTINLNYDPWVWDGFYQPSWLGYGGWSVSWIWGPSWTSWRNPWYNPWYPNSWYNGWYGTPWAGGWYGPWNPWYNSWYSDPWYGWNNWYGPSYGWHGHPHYYSKYDRYNTVYTGNRRPSGTMLGSRPSNQPTRHSYESALNRPSTSTTVRNPGTRPGSGQTTISSRPNINNSGSTSRPTQQQVNESRTTTRRPSTSTRNESNSNWQSSRPSNSGSNSGSSSGFSSSPVRTPASSGSFNRGSSGSGSSGGTSGGGVSGGSIGGGGVRRR